MATLRVTFDNGFIEVEEHWLERAKELVRHFGLANTTPAVDCLEAEMGVPRYDLHASQIMMIATQSVRDELVAAAEEKKAHKHGLLHI